MYRFFFFLTTMPTILIGDGWCGIYYHQALTEHFIATVGKSIEIACFIIAYTDYMQSILFEHQ